MTQVTVISEDSLIIVDGIGHKVLFDYPANLWAIQWDGTQGELEWRDGPNTPAALSDVAPYQDAWQTVHDISMIPYVLTAEDLALELNHTSRSYLADTDWYLTRKFETGTAVPQEVLIKRQEAREAIVAHV